MSANKGSTESASTMIALNRIETDDLQTRASIRQEAVREYAERIKAGERMAPAVVFENEGQYLLAAGFHRREAYLLAGKEVMPCIVKKGTQWDAISFGIKENQQHVGERLSQADRRHNVLMVLRHQPTLSDAQIAGLCGVTDKTAARCRRDAEASGEIPESRERVGRDGRRYRTDRLSSKRKRRGSVAASEECLNEGQAVPDSDSNPRASGASAGDGGASPASAGALDVEHAENDALHRVPTLKEIQEAEKRLGRAARAVDEMFETAKASTKYRQLRSLLNKVRDVLHEMHVEAENV